MGRLAPAKDNVLLLVTGLSPSAHARSSAEDPTPGWWEEMIGPGQALDTDRFHVICVNSLGSPHGSTSPACIDPRTGRPYRLTFPILAIEDIAAWPGRRCARWASPRVRAVVGPSLGGMTALAYAIQFPDEVHTLVTISSAARATPFAIAIRSVQREAIRSDPEWRGGDYEPPGPVNGLRVARKLGLITYRSAAEWRQRFSRERVEVRGPGAARSTWSSRSRPTSRCTRRSSSGTFDANCYLYLSRCMDLFDVAEHGGSVRRGSPHPGAHTLVVGVETDFLFPIDQQEEIAAVLERAGRDVRLVRLPSIQGHDSFLMDYDRFGPAVGSFLREVPP